MTIVVRFSSPQHNFQDGDYLPASQLNEMQGSTAWLKQQVQVRMKGIVSATTPTGNALGDLWYNTANNTLQAWNGNNWLTIGP